MLMNQGLRNITLVLMVMRLVANVFTGKSPEHVLAGQVLLVQSTKITAFLQVLHSRDI